MGMVLDTIGYIVTNEIINAINSATNDAEREKIISKVLKEAEKRGGDMLNKAMMKLNNIPSIASSPFLTSKLRAARREANDNYRNVEKAVADMRDVANSVQTDINAINSRGGLDKLFNKSKYDSQAKAIEQKAYSALNDIEQGVNSTGSNNSKIKENK